MPRDAIPGIARSFAIFAIFLRLGLTSFGGPVAHLGYFREAFVERRKWLGDRAYADLVALCQFLPGPASSQVGMARVSAPGRLDRIIKTPPTAMPELPPQYQAAL